MKRFFALALLLLAPYAARAHEVYVLSHEAIEEAMRAPSPNPMDSFASNEYQFFIWGFVAVVLVLTIFAISLFHQVEGWFGPMLSRIKKYAPSIARVTIGVCFVASAYYGAVFGPELPLREVLPGFEVPVELALFLVGMALVVGWYTRVAAMLGLLLMVLMAAKIEWYVINYATYAGLLVLTALQGGGLFSLDGGAMPRTPALRRIVEWLRPYSFLFMRVGFGVAVVFAAVYAKFLHSNLALQTIEQYNLTAYFQFEPLFIVLGACIIEILIGLFILLGIELRWTAIFFLFWLTLSLWYFGESVWPHLVLLGLNLTLIFHGYDRYTLEGRFFRHGRSDPVL